MRRCLCASVILLLAARPALAQITVIRGGGGDSLRTRQDSLRARGDSTRDTTIGRGKGLPRTPSRTFPQPDSIITELMKRPGFRVLRYAADSVQLRALDQEVRLAGKGLVEREGSTLEADSIRYAEKTCGIRAVGGPHLFDSSGVLIGEGMQYDACNQTGLVEHAKTDLPYQGGTWYVLGHMAFDNREDRVYAASAVMTTCDLIDPHYHFATKQVKWVNKRLMVARPAVLYVEDVPIAWLPFIFQDTRHGRRSGILSPGFGINEIVRFNPGYQRHISNIGYYWALSDYTDAQLSFDWYANTYTTINGRFRYRWLDRFLAGGIAYQELHQADGSTSRRISWSHQQQFSLASQLTASIDYATSSQIISRNAVDPVLAIGTIDSRVNYSTRFDWGMLNIGGSRTQSLDQPQVTATVPTVSFSPNPIAISRNVVWSPAFSFTNSIVQNGGSPIGVAVGPGLFDSLRTNSRSSNISLSTPLRIGTWNLSNSVNVSDEWSSTRTTVVDTAAHTVTTQAERFQTGVDWSTAIGLPEAFQGSWNLAPSVSMVNTGSGPYAVRNSYTNGQFVTSGKRFQFSLGTSPTLFALLPGFGPILRIRHAISPFISWSYSPAAEVPADYARALNQGQLPASLVQPARQSVSFGLSQNFEAKLRPPPPAPGDTLRAAVRDTSKSPGTPPEGRKLKLLSIQTSSISYDFEQAKLPGRNGWTTQALSNTISSDLLHGLSFSFTHDLWDGPVGYDSTRFKPYLTSVTFGFSMGANVLNMFRSILGLSPGPSAPRTDSLATPASPTNPGASFTNAFQRGPLATAFSSTDRMSPARGGQAFQASFNYSLQRTRTTTTVTTSGGTATIPGPVVTANSMLSGQMSFSPTAHWTVSWSTSYNFTEGQFSDHVVRLDRDLHDWRATFAFVKSPNGNFSFNFNIVLIPEPDLKVGYDQQTVR
ncbi:MAG: putative LPS assembly protein LptD [Gemmatimonadales bacterium]